MSTIFSKIIRGEVSADVVYRDDQVTCFRDINPAAPVHLLIVPNKEIATVNDLGEDDERLAGHMLLVARELAKREGIAESGYRLIVNCNREGGQEVYHLHMHLLGGHPMGPMVLRR
jgi:histidine triad (HIT) family protein